MDETKTCTSCGMSVDAADSVNEEGKCEQCAPAKMADESTDTTMGSAGDMAGEGMADKAEAGAEKKDETDDQG